MNLSALRCACGASLGFVFSVSVMATPSRVQLTTLSIHSNVNTPSESDLPQTVDLVTPPAPPSLSARIELVLFEPDGTRCAEFHYPQLTEVPQMHRSI